MNLILASQSPRRKELLGLMGLQFTPRPADIDEAMDPTREPREEVARVSRRKAEAVAKTAAPEDIILSADTIVVAEGQVLGKPKDRADARRMLKLLSGRPHQTMTGLTVLWGSRCITHVEVTSLCFRRLEEAEIEAYLDTGEPMDKAGAYAIQGKAALFISRLEGDYYNVMGLPVCSLTTILRQLGIPVLGCPEPTA